MKSARQRIRKALSRLADRRRSWRRQRKERSAAKPKLPARELRREPPGLLLDPTYYRLAYQLAAQRANRLAERGRKAQPRAAVPRRRRAGTAPDGAINDAIELADNVQRTLDWMEWMEKNSAWQWNRLLTVKERRLQRFLAATVRPSAELVVAGHLLYAGRFREADARVTRLLARGGSTAVVRAPYTRWASVEVIPWSGRALYSLACFEAARAERRGQNFRRRSRHELILATGREPQDSANPRELVAIWALRQAFRVSHDRQRRELVRWAQRDPVLKHLDEHKDTAQAFRALIKRYEIVTPPAPSAIKVVN